MFKEIVERQQSEYFAKQSALIEGRDGNFKPLVEGVTKIPGMSFGEPPYIVDDGEDALLLIDADGNYSRLPPDFYLSEESVNEDCDAFYTVPSPSTGTMIRLIPANSNYDFSRNLAAASESEDAYYAPLDELFELYMNAIVDLTREKAAHELMRKRTSLLKTCEENDIAFAKVLRVPGIARAMYAIFASSLADASEEIVKGLRGDDGDNDDD